MLQCHQSCSVILKRGWRPFVEFVVSSLLHCAKVKVWLQAQTFVVERGSCNNSITSFKLQCLCHKILPYFLNQTRYKLGSIQLLLRVRVKKIFTLGLRVTFSKFQARVVSFLITVPGKPNFKTSNYESFIKQIFYRRKKLVKQDIT